MYIAPTERNPEDPNLAVSKDIAYRGMLTYAQNGKEALFAAGVSADEYLPSLLTKDPPRILRSFDGMHWQPLNLPDRDRPLSRRQHPPDGLPLAGRVEGPPVCDGDTGPHRQRVAVRDHKRDVKPPRPRPGDASEPQRVRSRGVPRRPVCRLRQREVWLLGVGGKRRRPAVGADRHRRRRARR